MIKVNYSDIAVRAMGAEDLRAARRKCRGLFIAILLFSFCINLLMLAGPLYMMNVYDRVLGSRSIETLVALTVLVAFLYTMMAVLDLVRGRVMGRISARFQLALEERVFRASMKAADRPGLQRESITALSDLDAIQRLIASPVLGAFFDLPFSPLFFCGIFLFHPILGMLAVAGAGVLLALAVFNQLLSRPRSERAHASSVKADQIGRQTRQETELIQAMGMNSAAFWRWRQARGAALADGLRATDTSGGFSSVVRAFRLFLQSAMLGTGAYLVLDGKLTGGTMMAGSILLGRALAPIEIIVGQSAAVQRARQGWRSLSLLLGAIQPEEERTALPKPIGLLEVDQLSVVPPGQTVSTIRMVSFRIEPGQAVGVIGNSGAGKSSLARALAGHWQPAAGSIRLDGAALDQYDPDVRGRHVGYLPQRVTLFDGTIKENIARLMPDADDEMVVAAARKAGAHNMILQLSDGYDTRITAGAEALSGGQIQRIGLARALYGDPVLLILDEPNSNLDSEGSQALNTAIRAMKEAGACILVMAHRPAAIQECDLVLMIQDGARKAFGTKEEVMREMVRNHGKIVAARPAAQA